MADIDPAPSGEARSSLGCIDRALVAIALAAATALALVVVGGDQPASA